LIALAGDVSPDRHSRISGSSTARRPALVFRETNLARTAAVTSKPAVLLSIPSFEFIINLLLI
jgi:hypothetical protein